MNKIAEMPPVDVILARLQLQVNTPVPGRALIQGLGGEGGRKGIAEILSGERIQPEFGILVLDEGQVVPAKNTGREKRIIFPVNLTGAENADAVLRNALPLEVRGHIKCVIPRSHFMLVKRKKGEILLVLSVVRTQCNKVLKGIPLNQLRQDGFPDEDIRFVEVGKYAI